MRRDLQFFFVNFWFHSIDLVNKFLGTSRLSIKFSCTIPAIWGWWVGSILCWVLQEWWRTNALGASIFMFKVRDSVFWVLQGILISILKSASFRHDSHQWYNVSKAALHFSNTWHCRVLNLLGAQFLRTVELRLWCLRSFEMAELRFWWCLWFLEWQSFQCVLGFEFLRMVALRFGCLGQEIFVLGFFKELWFSFWPAILFAIIALSGAMWVKRHCISRGVERGRVFDFVGVQFS